MSGAVTLDRKRVRALLALAETLRQAGSGWRSAAATADGEVWVDGDGCWHLVGSLPLDRSPEEWRRALDGEGRPAPPPGAVRLDGERLERLAEVVDAVPGARATVFSAHDRLFVMLRPGWAAAASWAEVGGEWARRNLRLAGAATEADHLESGQLWLGRRTREES